MTHEELIQWLSDAAARAITQAEALADCPLREYAAMLVTIENALRAQRAGSPQVAYVDAEGFWVGEPLRGAVDVG